jgi:phage replication-related protein YjqB (UPF0714/DUF867 family)
MTYRTYRELRRCEKEGLDYRIRWRNGVSGITVMSPHGGEIELGTSEIGEAVAGKEHAFYAFEGIKPSHNHDLHITSTCFDEPRATRLAGGSRTVVAVHGCKGEDAFVTIGGRDETVKKTIRDGLLDAGFQVREDPRLPGKDPRNICNQGMLRKGVQLELSAGLRRALFQDLRKHDPVAITPLFERFVSVIRMALQGT